MMGPYLYYDTPFLEDVNTGFHIHDCMWSGECCSCQPSARLTFGSSHHCELQAVVVQQVADKLDQANSPSPSPSSSACSSAKAPCRGPTNAQIQAAMAVVQQQRISTVVQSAAGSTPAAIQIRALTQSPQSPPLANSGASSSATVSVTQSSSTTGRQAHRSSNSKKLALSSSKGSGSANHKKLRHREVEKNRHRQLQAMVKTLSEKIPGRLDKETQVQTMKRAARYCLYLRDVLNLVLAYTKAATNSGADTNPEAASLALRDKLENLYMRSCDNVELIMAQNMSTR